MDEEPNLALKTSDGDPRTHLPRQASQSLDAYRALPSWARKDPARVLCHCGTHGSERAEVEAVIVVGPAKGRIFRTMARPV